MSEQASGAAPAEVSAEDAESLASQFRPAWELDEAPFAGAGAPMKEDEVTALTQAAAPAAHEPAQFSAPQAQAAPAAATVIGVPAAPAPVATTPTNGNGPAAVTGSGTMLGGVAPANLGAGAQNKTVQLHKTMLGVAPQANTSPMAVPLATAPASQGPAPSVQPVVIQQNPPSPNQAPVIQAAQAMDFPEPERPIIRSERPPAIGAGAAARPPVRAAIARPIDAGESGEYSAVPKKKSNVVIIGVAVGFCALIGLGVIVKVALSSDQPPQTLSTGNDHTTTAAQAKAKDDIPPPPPKDDTPTTTTTAPLSQDIPVMKPNSLPKADNTPPPQTAAAPQPPRPQVAVASPPPRQPPQPPQPPKPPGGATKPPAKGGSGGIVRDTPF